MNVNISVAQSLLHGLLTVVLVKLHIPEVKHVTVFVGSGPVLTADYVDVRFYFFLVAF